MMCRELTPDYFAEICAPELLVSDVEARIGGSLLELVLMPEANYIAAIRSHPLEFVTLLGCAQRDGYVDAETVTGTIAALPDDIQAVMLEAAFFCQAQGFEHATPPAIH